MFMMRKNTFKYSQYKPLCQNYRGSSTRMQTYEQKVTGSNPCIIWENLLNDYLKAALKQGT